MIYEGKSEGDPIRDVFVVTKGTKEIPITIPYGTFSNVIKTKDFSTLERDIVENKYYAQDIGEIEAMSVKGQPEVRSLVQINGNDFSNGSNLEI